MKTLTKLAIAAAVPALAYAAPASAQVMEASDTFVVNLEGSVDSVCELLPNGSTTFDVDMTDFGNQGALAIAYNCNSPYAVYLESANGGMLNTTSSGVVNIPYDVEAVVLNVGSVNISSTAMNGSQQELVRETSWTNMFNNGGIAGGNIDLNFSGILDQWAVAGDYEDTLTITLAAEF